MVRRLAPRLSLSLALAAVAGACATSRTPGLPTGPVSLRVNTVDGDTLTLGSLRGKLVIVTIINTWAGTALVEIPHYKELLHRHADDLAIVCIAMDEHPEQVEIFASTFELPYPAGTVDDRAWFISRDGPFGPIGTVPTSVVLDRTGVIAVRMDGTWVPDVLESAIERLLAADPGKH